MKLSLGDVYNKSNRDEKVLLDEYNLRYNNSIKVPFTIKIKNKEHDCYYNIYEDLLNLMFKIKEEIAKMNTHIINDLELSNYLMNEIIKDEIRSTNLIEGVHSSRQDIDEILKDLVPKGKRLDEYKLVKSYKLLTQKSFPQIKTKEDISNNYRNLFEDFLADKDMLSDSNLFRNDFVGVYSGEKLIHPGINYQDINDEMDKLLNYMNDKEDENIIIKTAVFHFYFGYLHPFSDGNGRMNRFMTSYYLYDDLGICSLFISRNLLKNRDDYYRWFEKTEDLFNLGDLNYFIYNFINNIYESIRDFNEELENKLKFFQIIYSKLQAKYPAKNKELQKDMLFYIVRGYVFNKENTVTSSELIKVFKKAKSTVKTKLDEFINNGYIKPIDKVGNEIIYQLNANNAEIKEILRYE